MLRSPPEICTAGVLVAPPGLLLNVMEEPPLEILLMPANSLANWTFNLPPSLFTPMLLSVNLVLSAPPTISIVWFNFLEITLVLSVP